MNIKIVFSSVVIAASGMLGSPLQAAEITIVPPPADSRVVVVPPPPERVIIESPPPRERVVIEAPSEPTVVEETKTTETRRGILGRKKETTTTTRTETRP